MENFEIKNPTRNLKLLHKYDTIFSSDSVEWCPHEPFRNHFVCANYQLSEDESGGKSDKPRERSGRVLFFSSTPDELKLLQTINTAAILDQKWCHNMINDSPLLAVVNAEQSIEIYRLNPELVQLEIVTKFRIVGDATETLILSLDWNTGRVASQTPEIVCSDSKGNVHRFLFKNDELSLVDTCNAHEYEAWIAAYYYWDSNIFFTGGDDSMLLKFDGRIGSTPISKNRSHNAGVTCIHSNCSREYVIASGSYDTYLRLWDIRQMKNPTSELEMPGTLWRLKWDPFEQRHLLAACMLGGVHVVDATKEMDLKIVESFYEHKNIAYGADWCHSRESTIIGTCSFYDHLLCLSKINIQ